MSKKFLLAVSLGLILSLNTKAEVPALNQFYKGVYLGEKKTPNYNGPLDPRAQFSETKGELVLIDDLFKESYLSSNIQTEPFQLHNFWFRELVEKSTCPDEVLSQNMDYIRYLYRLVSISYLFEALKLSNKLSVQLGGQKICSLDYNALFGKCKPQTEDMKKFKERVYGKFVNEISKIKHEPFTKKEKINWMDSFQKSTSLSSDPIESRLHDWCRENKKNCRNLSEDDVKSALTNFCQNDTEMISQICSENDSLYGLSQNEKASELIRKSNAFNLVNQTGMGEECMRRYTNLFENKEIPYLSFNRIYPYIYSFLVKTDSPYLQGELFLPGALKEFDMKGLSDFLIALKPPKVEPVAIKPKAKPKAKPKVVIAPEPVVVKPVEQPPVVKQPEPVVPKLTEFESKALLITEKGEAKASLNMDTFRDDFEFTQDMINELATPMKKFQTRSALTDMKSYDLLGSKEAPVGLVFLKYLLDTDNHQGLYNILSVLGEKFYVINDIEKKTTPLYMELKNDSTTNNRWQIILLKEPQKK